MISPPTTYHGLPLLACSTVDAVLREFPSLDLLISREMTPREGWDWNCHVRWLSLETLLPFRPLHVLVRERFSLLTSETCSAVWVLAASYLRTGAISEKAVLVHLSSPENLDLVNSQLTKKSGNGGLGYSNRRSRRFRPKLEVFPE